MASRNYHPTAVISAISACWWKLANILTLLVLANVTVVVGQVVGLNLVCLVRVKTCSRLKVLDSTKSYSCRDFTGRKYCDDTPQKASHLRRDLYSLLAPPRSSRLGFYGSGEQSVA